jgi:hypothetical protein
VPNSFPNCQYVYHLDVQCCVRITPVHFVCTNLVRREDKDGLSLARLDTQKRNIAHLGCVRAVELTDRIVTKTFLLALMREISLKNCRNGTNWFGSSGWFSSKSLILSHHLVLRLYRDRRRESHSQRTWRRKTRMTRLIGQSI